jgi:hypothetical protein
LIRKINAVKIFSIGCLEIIAEFLNECISLFMSDEVDKKIWMRLLFKFKHNKNIA